MDNVNSPQRFGDSPTGEGLHSSQSKDERRAGANIADFCQERHKTMRVEPRRIEKWRIRDRMKTSCVALVYCLNIGVDPPDVMKTEPCARLECWIDPLILPSQKALETIGKALQSQYERWQPRVRYKLSMDPTVDDIKKLCISSRRNAKDERVLFHYNGHGVPKPTDNGEIWAFNKNYTQYIPLSIYELQTWLSGPSFYIFDCSGAGTVVKWFLQFAEQREKEILKRMPSTINLTKDFIILAACQSHQLLPMNPSLPADIFTSCLTTPIKVALRWFCTHSLLAKEGLTLELLDQLPGVVSDRKSPLGELNWIFMAITETIAWNTLPMELFQKLFRQDVLLAAIFRNFLFADRVMRSLGCTPISVPKLPQTHQHPMWQAWDLTVDMCLSQLPEMLDNSDYKYQPNSFFTDQLKAFEVWLEFGSEKKRPPEQLPILLQVLPSQLYRLQALQLLSRFVDLGPWAVNLALSVGTLPYVLKLLSLQSAELRKELIFIWTKILALDKSCQIDLVKECGHVFFIRELANSEVPNDERAMAAFALSVIVNNYRPGQVACLENNLLPVCLSQLKSPNALLRRWATLSLAKLWESFDDAKRAAEDQRAHNRMAELLNDPIPEVRAAAVYALGIFIDGNPERRDIELSLSLSFTAVINDASSCVRKTLAEALARLINAHEERFKEDVSKLFADEVAKDLNRKKARQKGEELPTPSGDIDSTISEGGSVWMCIWKMIVHLTWDPFPEVARIAETSMLFIRDQVRGFTPPQARPKLISKAKLFKRGTRQSPTSSSPSQLSRTPSLDLGRVPSEDSDDFPFEESVTFYEWSCEYYRSSLYSQGREDVSQVSQRLWREQRNAAVMERVPSYRRVFESSPNARFDEQAAILDNSPDNTSTLLFHPFEPTVIVANDKDGISVWDHSTCQRIHSFRNRSTENPNFSVISRTTQMIILNPHDISRLLVGSDDGVIRVWGSFDEPQNNRLVTAWRLPKLLPHTTRSSGFVMNWQPENSLLVEIDPLEE